MEYAEIVNQLAPCGLNCCRCADFAQGEIQRLSTALLHALGDDYGRVAQIRAGQTPAFAQYSVFEEILQVFSQAACGGCRSASNQCPQNCRAKTCHKEQGVEFCFQCAEYPCDRQTGVLRKRWLALNDRMREIGIEAYFCEQAKLPRY